MNIPEGLSETLTDVRDAIQLYGTNKSKIPLGLAYHDHEWWVWIDLRTPLTTYDIEVHNPDLIAALLVALSRLRREYRILRGRAA